MSWSLTLALASIVFIIAAALVKQLYPQDDEGGGHKREISDRSPSRSSRACGFCGRPHDSTTKLKECTGCRITRYCSQACQSHHWTDHKAFCRYIQDCRKTTYHDALVIPADGGPAVLRKVGFSVEGAAHQTAPFLRAVDLREVFGDEITQARYHRIKVEEQEDAVNGEYLQYYTVSPRLPLNQHLLRQFPTKDLPADKFWRGDVVIVKMIDKSLTRPKEFKDLAKGITEVEYVDLPGESRPVIQHWLQRFYDVGFEEAESVYGK